MLCTSCIFWKATPIREGLSLTNTCQQTIRTQRSLSIADTSKPDIFGIFCCNIAVFLFQSLKMYW